MKYETVNVYAANETDFSHNGICVLSPLSVTVTEILDGEYSMTLTQPKDLWGNWRYLVKGNVLKVQGQLFRIFHAGRGMDSDGNYSNITAEAMHISYDLNYYFIKDVRPTLKTARNALEWLITPEHSGYRNILNGDPRERFSFYTDLDSTLTAENIKTAYYEKMSVTKALIGAENCFLNVWGGHIVRDNFDISILKRRGNDNAFSIRYGVDMIEIGEISDISDYAASLYYEATLYNEAISGTQKERTENIMIGEVETEDSSLHFPVKPMRAYSFEVNVKDIKSEGDIPTLSEIRAECERRAKIYLFTECQPKVNLQVKFADLKNLDIYEDFIGLQMCNLGDTGTIFHEGLGINAEMQIIKRSTDGLTGEVIGIELGNLRRSITDDIVKKR